jgi:hypothetical protein
LLSHRSDSLGSSEMLSCWRYLHAMRARSCISWRSKQLAPQGHAYLIAASSVEQTHTPR